MGRPRKRPFVQLDADLYQTADLAKFAQRLKPHMPEAARPFAIDLMHSAIVRVYSGFLVNIPSGLWSETAPEMVEYWAGWRGDSGAFAAAFCDLWCEPDTDGLRLRGWAKRYAALMPKPLQVVAKQKVETKTPPRRREPDRVPTQQHDEFPVQLLDENDTENGAFIGTKKLEVRELLSGDAANAASPAPRPADGPAVGLEAAVTLVQHRGAVAVDARALAAAGSITALVEREVSAIAFRPAKRPATDEQRTPEVPASPPVGTAVARKGRAPRTAAVAESNSAPRESRAKWPHFSADDRVALFAIWEKHVKERLTEATKGFFVREFARWYQEPEESRAPEWPRNAEVIAALEELLSSAVTCIGGDRYRSIPAAARAIGTVVDTMRENTADPLARAEAVERALNLRPRLANAT